MRKHVVVLAAAMVAAAVVGLWLGTREDETRVAPLNRYLAGDDLWNVYQALRRRTHGGELVRRLNQR